MFKVFALKIFSSLEICSFLFVLGQEVPQGHGKCVSQGGTRDAAACVSSVEEEEEWLVERSSSLKSDGIAPGHGKTVLGHPLLVRNNVAVLEGVEGAARLWGEEEVEESKKVEGCGKG